MAKRALLQHLIRIIDISLILLGVSHIVSATGSGYSTDTQHFISPSFKNPYNISIIRKQLLISRGFLPFLRDFPANTNFFFLSINLAKWNKKKRKKILYPLSIHGFPGAIGIFFHRNHMLQSEWEHSIPAYNYNIRRYHLQKGKRYAGVRADFYIAFYAS